MRKFVFGISLVFVSIIFSTINTYASDFRISVGIYPYSFFENLEIQQFNDFFYEFNSVLDQEKLEFLEFVNTLTPNQEITFDYQRTITGIAPYNTSVSLFVIVTNYNPDGTKKVGLYQNYVTVGSSGVFSLNTPLQEGVNTIIIILNAQDEQYTPSFVAAVRRMSLEIKHELEGFSIRLPGDEVNLSVSPFSEQNIEH